MQNVKNEAMKKFVKFLIFACTIGNLYAQDDEKEKQENRLLDSLFIQEVENPKEKNLPDKVLHAEPLYIDLISRSLKIV